MDPLRRAIRFAGIPAVDYLALTAAGQVPTTTWTGGGDGSDWFDGANWDHGVPLNGATGIVNSGGILLTNATADLTAFTMTGGTLTFSNWVACLKATNVWLEGGTLTHAINSATATNAAGEWVPDARIWIVCTNLTLDAAINVSAKGYQHGFGNSAILPSGPGASPGGGGAYGGLSGNNGGTIYGEPEAPEQPGSGGGGRTAGSHFYGGHGGGAIRIEASGHLRIEAVYGITLDGLITANGRSFGWRAGGGGGGGGRIAIWRIFDQSSGVVASAAGGENHVESDAHHGADGTVVWGQRPPAGMVLRIR